MEFPERLLPQPHFTFIDFEAVPRLWLVLIRHTETAEIWDEYNRLKSDHVSFQTDHLHDYSTNLLGHFQINDIGWKWPKDSPFTTLWQSGQLVNVPVWPGEVDWINSRGSFFLTVPACYQITFAVETPTGMAQATCYVLHTPICGNFWHCSLRWLFDEDDVTKWAVKRRKHILKAARTFIIQHAQAAQPIYEPVSVDAYNG